MDIGNASGRNMKSNELSFVAAIQQALRVFMAEEIHTCLPGRIESYNSETRKATVLPLIKKKYLDGTSLEYQPISDVPVMTVNVGNSGLRLPESQFKGQTVTLVFSERSLDYWLSKGGIAEPGNNRKFDLTDAIAIVSLNPFTKKDSGGDDLEMYYGDSLVRIKKDGMIEIGVDTFKRLITEEFADLFNNHVHNFTAAPSGAFSTSTPAKSTGVIPTTPAGGAVALFDATIDDSHMTSITKAE